MLRHLGMISLINHVFQWFIALFAEKILICCLHKRLNEFPNTLALLRLLLGGKGYWWLLECESWSSSGQIIKRNTSIQIFFPSSIQIINTNWLVVEPTPLKNDGVRQLGWFSIPNCFWKVIQNSMVPVTTNQSLTMINHCITIINIIKHH